MKWKTVLTIGLPIVGVIGLIIWVKKGNRSAGVAPNAVDNKPAALIPPPAPKNSSFPLRNGSRNSYVTQLQQALGISADGIFGTQTENALRSAAGITSIRDEKEFNDVLAKIKGTTSAFTDREGKLARGNDLLQKFKTGNYSIQGLEKSFWEKGTTDYSGAFNRSGTGIYINKGITLNKADYSLVEVTQLGNIIIYVNKGTLMGSYIGDPRTITLV